jgi:hypothetical protein
MPGADADCTPTPDLGDRDDSDDDDEDEDSGDIDDAAGITPGKNVIAKGRPPAFIIASTPW